jgi:starch-binding outer membrane protein, SusD/RagB family
MRKIKSIYQLALLATAINLASCTKEYPNNNAPEERDVLKTADGLIPLIVGIKARWSSSGFSAVYGAITCSGLSTGELTVLNAGNADLANLLNGNTTLVNNNGTVYNLWACCNNVMSEANKVIVNAPNVADPGTKAAIQAYGHFFKAIAIGTMAQFWENVPTTNGTNVPFKTRAEALAEAATLLDQAAALISATPIPAAINSRIGTEISIVNACNALAARYYNMLGQHANSIARANAASQTIRSQFIYDGTFQNPVFRSSLTTNNVYGIRPNFGLAGSLLPDAGDGRIAFYLSPNAARGSGHFLSDLTSIPVYQPGEMLLIKAEAFARQNQLDSALANLNRVRTKTAGGDAFGVGAGLATFSSTNQQAVLDEVYRQRCIELYMSGLKLEDSRRFGRPAPTVGTPNSGERNRNYYPYPQQERDGNTSTPPDPAI